MHEILMEGVRGENKNPGKFRESQNWIGPKGCKIEEATYVPPSPLILNDLLETFIEFINAEGVDLDPIVQTALVHAQFELVHPFDDGNGRIGRLLVPLLLMKKGCLVSPSLYISGYLESHRDEYYGSLERVSREGDWLGWVRFFLNALVYQAENNLELVRRIKDLYEQRKYEITDLLHTDQGIHVLDMLFDTPVFRSTDVYKRLGIQRQRAAIYIRKLSEADIIRELRPPGGSRAALYSFEALLRITDQQ